MCILFDLVYYFLIYFFLLCLVLFDPLLKQFICIFFSLPCYSSHLHFVCPVPLFHHFVIIHLCHRFFPLPITLQLPASPYPPVFSLPRSTLTDFFLFYITFFIFQFQYTDLFYLPLPLTSLIIFFALSPLLLYISSTLTFWCN